MKPRQWRQKMTSGCDDDGTPTLDLDIGHDELEVKGWRKVRIERTADSSG